MSDDVMLDLKLSYIGNMTQMGVARGAINKVARTRDKDSKNGAPLRH